MYQPRAKLGLSASARSTNADHRADVLAEIAQREGGIRQDARIVAGHFQGAPGEIGALPAVRLRIFAPAVDQAAEYSRRAAQASAGP